MRLRAFAVEDTTAQVWARGRRGPMARTVTGLEPGLRQPVEAFGQRTLVTTLAPPPGAELCRIATVNDLHIGATEFGFLPRIVEGEVDEPHPLRCARAALAEALAWGAQMIVVKGDLTEEGTPANWEAVGDLLAGLPVRVAVVPGNHDVHHHREVDAQPSLSASGLHLVHGVEAVDLPGVRLLLVDTTEHDRDDGRVAHVEAEVVRLLARAHGAGMPAIVAMHHHPQRFRLPLFWPPGIPGPEANRFLRAVADANPRTLVTTGHTHRHRRHQRGTLTVTEVGSTKDYPGTWTGYVVHEGGIRQLVHRVEEPSCLAWTDRTRRAFGGVWRWWSPGTLADRCFTIPWPACSPPRLTVTKSAH